MLVQRVLLQPWPDAVDPLPPIGEGRPPAPSVYNTQRELDTREVLNRSVGRGQLSDAPQIVEFMDIHELSR